MAQMTVIYRTPKDPDAFLKHYFTVHVPLAKRLPGLLRYEVSRGPVIVRAGDPDVFLVGNLYFEDLAAMRAAFASPEGEATAADRRVLAPEDSDLTMLLYDRTEV